MTFNDLVAQLAHIGWGALLVDSLSRRIRLLYALLLVAFFYVSKELIESLWGVWESRQPWSSGIEDMTFWTVGLLIGYFIYRCDL
jgi:hypothetical protein